MTVDLTEVFQFRSNPMQFRHNRFDSQIYFCCYPFKSLTCENSTSLSTLITAMQTLNCLNPLTTHKQCCFHSATPDDWDKTKLQPNLHLQIV